MKTMTTRATGMVNATKETKEDESSSSYFSMDYAEGKDKKGVDINGFDDVNGNNDKGKKNMSSAIKKNKGREKI